MVRALIRWAVANPLIVGLLAVALIAVGVYSFLNVNVEAYPDPAPAIVEVVAQYPGQSAEDVERQVTIPLEIAFRPQFFASWRTVFHSALGVRK